MASPIRLRILKTLHNGLMPLLLTSLLKFQSETGSIPALYLRNRFPVKHFRFTRNFSSLLLDIGGRDFLVKEVMTELLPLAELQWRLV